MEKLWWRYIKKRQEEQKVFQLSQCWWKAGYYLIFMLFASCVRIYIYVCVWKRCLTFQQASGINILHIYMHIFKLVNCLIFWKCILNFTWCRQGVLQIQYPPYFFNWMTAPISTCVFCGHCITERVKPQFECMCQKHNQFFIYL